MHCWQWEPLSKKWIRSSFSLCWHGGSLIAAHRSSLGCCWAGRGWICVSLKIQFNSNQTILVYEPVWSNEPNFALQPCLKLVTATTHVHAFWEGDSSMEHKCGRTRRWWGRCPRKNKLHFFRKDGFISIGFGNINAILIFCLIWYWVLFPEEFTIG